MAFFTNTNASVTLNVIDIIERQQALEASRSILELLRQRRQKVNPFLKNLTRFEGMDSFEKIVDVLKEREDAFVDLKNIVQRFNNISFLPLIKEYHKLSPITIQNNNNNNNNNNILNSPPLPTTTTTTTTNAENGNSSTQIESLTQILVNFPSLFNIQIVIGLALALECLFEAFLMARLTEQVAIFEAHCFDRDVKEAAKHIVHEFESVLSHSESFLMFQTRSLDESLLAKKLVPRFDSNSHMELGRLLLLTPQVSHRNVDCPSSALEELNRALEQDPTNPLAHSYIARGKFSTNLDVQIRIHHIDKAIAVEPRNVRWHRIRAELYMRVARTIDPAHAKPVHENAVKSLRNVIRFEPSSIMALLTLIGQYEHLERDYDMIDCYRRLIAAEPNNPDWRFLYATILYDDELWYDCRQETLKCLDLLKVISDKTLAKSKTTQQIDSTANTNNNNSPLSELELSFYTSQEKAMARPHYLPPPPTFDLPLDDQDPHQHHQQHQQQHQQRMQQVNQLFGPPTTTTNANNNINNANNTNNNDNSNNERASSTGTSASNSASKSENNNNNENNHNGSEKNTNNEVNDNNNNNQMSDINDYVEEPLKIVRYPLFWETDARFLLAMVLGREGRLQESLEQFRISWKISPPQRTILNEQDFKRINNYIDLLVTALDTVESLTEAKNFIEGFSLMPVFPAYTISELTKRIETRQQDQIEALKGSRQRTALLVRWVGRVCLREKLKKNKKLSTVFKLVCKTICGSFLNETQMEKALQLELPAGNPSKDPIGTSGMPSSLIEPEHGKSHNRKQTLQPVRLVGKLFPSLQSTRRKQFFQLILGVQRKKPLISTTTTTTTTNTTSNSHESPRQPQPNRSAPARSNAKRARVNQVAPSSTTSTTSTTTTTTTTATTTNNNNNNTSMQSDEELLENESESTISSPPPVPQGLEFDEELEEIAETSNNNNNNDNNEEIEESGEETTPKKRKRSPKPISKKKVVTKKSRR